MVIHLNAYCFRSHPPECHGGCSRVTWKQLVVVQLMSTYTANCMGTGMITDKVELMTGRSALTDVQPSAAEPKDSDSRGKLSKSGLAHPYIGASPLTVVCKSILCTSDMHTMVMIMVSSDVVVR